MIKHLVMLMLFSSANCFANDILSDEILKRIDTAQSQLHKVQQDINNEHHILAKQIQEKLSKIKALRQKAANIQRAEDEQLLSLETLKSRVQAWQAQQNYQQQLVQSFASQTQSPLADSNNIIQFEQVKAFLEKKLSPSWKTKQIIDNSSQLQQFETLALGPISVAVNESSAGFINDDNALLRISTNTLNDNGTLFSSLSQLRAQGQTELHFDPTLGNADKLNQQQLSISAYIQKGGIWAYPILLFAFFALMTALFKAQQFLRLPKLASEMVDKIETYIHQQDSTRLQTYVTTLAPIQKSLVEIAQSTPISQKRDDSLIAQLKDQKYRNEKYLGVITTCAAVAPLLGLLGTVSGMIHTFMMMNVFGSGDASVVSGGISQALITTELGLIVAIPALIASALLNKKSKSFDIRLEAIATKLSKVEFNSNELKNEQ
ncbi:MotA/TolQ/ExbB proton channel family protein [Pseudoalteromonas sp. MMG012]|uniref:MotA/TolQ/ExbB proton channel family protein n=1 Tax=Pseudoalteromonas sp. MMG012 TaxID=2822686 RepID=UPI001B3A43B6|nr:MotA/TolQ/ExbB proton channel family protein [Pseudoalteromonas sp. MMG012]MBQ4851842.1 MotA/TolQ/ExbB proton channel family protein [Pseudoalteromonas sp. MMG012]